MDAELTLKALVDLPDESRCPLTSIDTPEAWRALIADLRPELLTSVAVSTAPPLLGGYALMRGGEELAGPTCCSDLGTLAEWRAVVADPPAQWAELWCGHPCLVVRCEAESLLLGGYIEPGDQPTPEPGATVHEVDLAALRRAITRVEEELEHAAGLLAQALVGGVPAPRDVARCLLGLEGF